MIDAENKYLLAEAKHQKRKIGIPEIEEVRNRLRRLPPDTAGAIFSISDFGASAIYEVEADRTKEIFLFNKQEIERLISFESNLQSLIHQKRESLRTSGTVWFFQPPQYTRYPLRDTTQKFQINTERSSSIKLQTGYTRLLFSQNIPDTRWAGYGEQGVALHLRLSVENKKQLRDFLALIDDRFGLSNDGSYVIEQSFASWHGVGAKSFVEDVGRLKQRYETSGDAYIHHSEDLAYFDSFKGGWILFTARQNVKRYQNTAPIYESEVLIQLPGIPVDILPFLNLCRETNNLDARFYPVSHNELKLVRFKRPIKLTTISVVVDVRGNDINVCGFIAKNPFFDLKKFPAEFKKCDFTIAPLAETELLICDSIDWHEFGDKIDYYILEGMEGFWAGSHFIIRPFGTWHNMLDHKRKLPEWTDSKGLPILPTKRALSSVDVSSGQ